MEANGKGGEERQSWESNGRRHLSKHKHQWTLWLPVDTGGLAEQGLELIRTDNTTYHQGGGTDFAWRRTPGEGGRTFPMIIHPFDCLVPHLDAPLSCLRRIGRISSAESCLLFWLLSSTPLLSFVGHCRQPRGQQTSYRCVRCRSVRALPSLMIPLSLVYGGVAAGIPKGTVHNTLSNGNGKRGVLGMRIWRRPALVQSAALYGPELTPQLLVGCGCVVLRVGEGAF